MGKKWSNWININDKSGYNKCAIYEVRIVDSKRKVICIERLAGKDQMGIMCIGETKYLDSRINTFRLTMENNRSNHSEGSILFLIIEYCKAFRKKFRCSRYQYRFMKLRTKKEAQKQEAMRIIGYFKRFGEVPPLNSAIPDSAGDRFPGSWTHSKFP